MVIWLLGISGAGKTTLGRQLIAHYENKYKSYLIDGDDIRNFFENDLGYTREDRMINIKRIILGAYLCDENDIFTVVANISPFEELREFARGKIRNYNEFYLRKNINVSIKNDVKGIYRDNMNKTDMVGINVNFEEPQNSDLIIDTDVCTEEEALKLIIDFIDNKYA